MVTHDFLACADTPTWAERQVAKAPPLSPSRVAELGAILGLVLPESPPDTGTPAAA